MVLISMARSDNTGLGFAKNQRRANVLLSRASQLMVIFGDAKTLTQGEAITTDKLVPAMAYYASMNNSMFRSSPTLNWNLTDLFLLPLLTICILRQSPK